MKIRSIARISALVVATNLPILAVAQNLPTTVAPGNVKLHIAASGMSTNVADSITIFVPISTTGETAAAARAANSKSISDLRKSLVAHRVDPESIALLPTQARLGFVGNEAFDPEAPQVPATLAAAMPSKSAFSTMQIKFSDPALISRVRDALDEQNLAMSSAPLLSLRDDRTAKSAAIADALASARKDADAYALPLGLKVIRIENVSNVGETNVAMTDPAFFARLLAGAQDGGPNNVVTRVQIWIDFELAPR